MRTTVDIDAALLKRLRVEARKRGVTVKELLATALRRGLDAAPEGAASPFHAITFHLGAVFPGVDIDKAMSIAHALDADEVARKLGMRK